MCQRFNDRYVSVFSLHGSSVTAAAAAQELYEMKWTRSMWACTVYNVHGCERAMPCHAKLVCWRNEKYTLLNVLKATNKEFGSFASFCQFSPFPTSISLVSFRFGMAEYGSVRFWFGLVCSCCALAFFFSIHRAVYARSYKTWLVRIFVCCVFHLLFFKKSVPIAKLFCTC